MADRILKTDVLVLGSGPSGFAAALAAEKNIPLTEVSAGEIRRKIGI